MRVVYTSRLYTGLLWPHRVGEPQSWGRPCGNAVKKSITDRRNSVCLCPSLSLPLSLSLSFVSYSVESNQPKGDRYIRFNALRRRSRRETKLQRNEWVDMRPPGLDWSLYCRQTDRQTVLLLDDTLVHCDSKTHHAMQPGSGIARKYKDRFDDC